MGYLAATGAYLILALAIGFIIMVVGLFRRAYYCL